MNIVIPTFALGQIYKSFGQLQSVIKLIVPLLDNSHNNSI